MRCYNIYKFTHVITSDPPNNMTSVRIYIIQFKISLHGNKFIFYILTFSFGHAVESPFSTLYKLRQVQNTVGKILLSCLLTFCQHFRMSFKYIFCLALCIWHMNADMRDGKLVFIHFKRRETPVLEHQTFKKRIYQKCWYSVSERTILVQMIKKTFQIM